MKHNLSIIQSKTGFHAMLHATFSQHDAGDVPTTMLAVPLSQ
jgi:hypothetical protein